MIALSLLILIALGLAVTSVGGLPPSAFSSWPFIVAWTLTAAIGVIEIIRLKLYRHPTLFTLHSALLLILCGALFSHLWGESQLVHIRQSQTEFIGRHAVTLISVEVEHAVDGDTPISITGTMDIDGREITSEVNHPASTSGLQLCQTAYDTDGHGLTLSVTDDQTGWHITLAGYVLLLISMIATINLRPILKALKRPACFLSLLLVVVWVAWQLAQSLERSQSLIILRSPLLTIHVACVMLAYGLFAIIAAYGAVSFFTNRSLTTADALLRPAVYLLMAGVFIGAVWARMSWGRYWGWDPKETWALITLILYSLPLHRRLLPCFGNNRFRALFYLLALTSVITTYLGVNYLMGGLHSYAG